MNHPQPFTVFESSYPHSLCGVYSAYISESITNQLFALLPHGSGINYVWHCYQHKTNSNRFTCHNAYSAMNENGYYCHVYPFSVTFDYNPTTGLFEYVRFSFKGNREYSCCGFGILEYLKDEMFYSLEFRQDKE